ncbi:DUF523 and DUF1722 domain-containing protein [Methanolobus sp. ZRKC2]|uniref:YbgA family protein n=1 Tax=Methanolobus sp. ZRKC2 TaxID=3125783 RepID=UPI0032446158
MQGIQNFPRPIVLVSKCLEFENVRYNGQLIHSQVVRDLEPMVDFIKVCPEVGIGLGVPREPIRIVKEDDNYRLVQPKTGRDVTTEMDDFTDNFMDRLDDVDGFIFKSGSPTIGIRNIKVYSGTSMAPVVERGAGFFAKKIIARYAGHPMEEDDRLRNYRIRNHFLTQLYTFADFRCVKRSLSQKELEVFNRKNYFLFSFYDDSVYGKMCELLEQVSTRGLEKTVEAYETLLKDLMQKPGDLESGVVVARKIVSPFNESMPSGEKQFFENLLRNYIEKRIDEDALQEVLRLLVLHYDAENVKNYTFLYPYPDILRMPCDGKRDKDYWSDH